MSPYIKKIRPVGNTINTTKNNIDDSPFSPFYTQFYNSGTASLAATIIAAIKLKPDINNPEVIVPAYGCPDLISAVIYAKAIPVLVDLEPDSPQMSLQHLKNLVSDKTVAVIAVRFFGIPERNEELYQIAKSYNAILIEDSAQGFPVHNMDSYWQGDFVILSFGRGKPVNLLGGGAVLARNQTLMNLLPDSPTEKNSLKNDVKYILKLFLYNLSIQPTAYGLITKIPGLNIGLTVYKPLNALGRMSDFSKQRLTSNLKSYRNRINQQKEYLKFFKKGNGELVYDLPSKLSYDMSQPLLRYPVIVKNESMRKQLYKKLKPYGASIMYKEPLHEIENVGRLLKQPANDYPNANKFARQLLTLPTHEAANKKVLLTIQEIIKNT